MLWLRSQLLYWASTLDLAVVSLVKKPDASGFFYDQMKVIDEHQPELFPFGIGTLKGIIAA